MKYWRFDVHPECRRGIPFPNYIPEIEENIEYFT